MLTVLIDIDPGSNTAAPIAYYRCISLWSGVNNVDIRNGVVAAAVENESTQSLWRCVFFRHGRQGLKFNSGRALPDMLTFTPDGQKVLVANEENRAMTTIDLKALSIIDL